MTLSLTVASKLIRIITFLSCSLIFNDTIGQGIYAQKCERFLKQKTLYVIDHELNTTKITTSLGHQFTFEEAVREAWPEREVVKISSDEYDKLEDVQDKFYFSIELWPIRYSENVELGHLPLVKVGSGKTNAWNLPLYYIGIHWEEMKKGILAERLIYYVQNLKSMLENYQDGSYRKKGVYKSNNYEKCLKSKTIYFRENHLHDKLRESDALKKIYPYSFKIVSDQEWETAVKSKMKDILYIDYAETSRGWKQAMYIFDAEKNELVFGKYRLRLGTPLSKKIITKSLL